METRNSKSKFMEKDNLDRKNNAAHKQHVRALKERAQSQYDDFDDDEDLYTIRFEPVSDED